MKPALIIIDVQNGIDEYAYWGGNRNNPEAEGNIKLLLNLWRRQKLPIVIVKHDSVNRHSPFRPGQVGNDLKGFMQPVDGELIINKSTASAFIKTDLERWLREAGITELVITGFVTNNSVEATARMAGDLGFQVVVAADATACFNKTGSDGTIYSSELIHQISLANLAGEYASVETTSAIVRKITNFNTET